MSDTPSSAEGVPAELLRHAARLLRGTRYHADGRSGIFPSHEERVMATDLDGLADKLASRSLPVATAPAKHERSLAEALCEARYIASPSSDHHDLAACDVCREEVQRLIRAPSSGGSGTDWKTNAAVDKAAARVQTAIFEHRYHSAPYPSDALGALCEAVAAVPSLDREGTRDTERLDWLDAKNRPFRMGWQARVTPAGNVYVSSIIQLGDQPLTPIRDAIDAAMPASPLQGEARG